MNRGRGHPPTLTLPNSETTLQALGAGPQAGRAPERTPALQLAEYSQVETVSEENKSFLWVLLRQLRPGVDLSRVALPTFVLEPRSFLCRLADHYHHADLLSR